jgi:hypothetical protein
VIRVPNAAFRFKPLETATADGKASGGAPNSSMRKQEGGAGMGGGGGGGRGGQGRGGGGVGGSEQGGARPRPERAMTRTVYLLPSPANSTGKAAEPQRVEIKTGITDGIMTEVLSDLPEGAQVITAILSGGPSRSTMPAGNPFGGGPRRF